MRPLVALLRTVPLPHTPAAAEADRAKEAEAAAAAAAAAAVAAGGAAAPPAPPAPSKRAPPTDPVTAAAALLVLTHTCHALENVALFDGARALLVQEGALTPVVHLLGSAPPSAPELLARAAGVLRNVARHDGSRATIAAEGAIPPLVLLLSSSLPSPPIAPLRTAACLKPSCSAAATAGQRHQHTSSAGGPEPSSLPPTPTPPVPTTPQPAASGGMLGQPRAETMISAPPGRSSCRAVRNKDSTARSARARGDTAAAKSKKAW